MKAWLKDFHNTVSKNPNAISTINFKDYEAKFLKQVLKDFSEECKRLDKLDNKNQQRIMCCDVLINLMNNIILEIKASDNSNLVLTDQIAPYLSMEAIYMKLMKSYCGENSYEKDKEYDTFLKMSLDRIHLNLRWILNQTNNTKLEFFKKKMVSYISHSILTFKYQNLANSTLYSAKPTLESMTPTEYLTAQLKELILEFERNSTVEIQHVQEVAEIDIPRVDKLEFYEEEEEGLETQKKFMDILELGEEKDIINKSKNERKTILKVIADRDMMGEVVNLRGIFDKIESRSYKYYKRNHQRYFEEPQKSFEKLSYSYIIGGLRKFAESESSKSSENLPISSLLDCYWASKAGPDLQTYFKEQLKEAERSVLTYLSKEREARKDKILSEAKEGDLKELNDDYEDEEIIAHVREKYILKKLLITTQFWYDILMQGFFGLSLQRQIT